MKWHGMGMLRVSASPLEHCSSATRVAVPDQPQNKEYVIERRGASVELCSYVCGNAAGVDVSMNLVPCGCFEIYREMYREKYEDHR